MEESHDMVEDIESGSSDSGSDSFIDDSEVDEVSISGQDDGLHLQACSESRYLFNF
jgi:transcriptional regulator ATRX